MTNKATPTIGNNDQRRSGAFFHADATIPPKPDASMSHREGPPEPRARQMLTTPKCASRPVVGLLRVAAALRVTPAPAAVKLAAMFCCWKVCLRKVIGRETYPGDSAFCPDVIRAEGSLGSGDSSVSNDSDFSFFCAPPAGSWFRTTTIRSFFRTGCLRKNTSPPSGGSCAIFERESGSEAKRSGKIRIFRTTREAIPVTTASRMACRGQYSSKACPGR